MNKGVLVGADQKQEWLLLWWWKNYSEENELPVCFVDFGMSEKGRKWCQKRGQLLLVEEIPLHSVDSSLALKWNENISPFWGSTP